MDYRPTFSPYILITPAFNEDAFIEKTIRSVIAQTVKPLLWIVVNDGSTDQTSHVIKGFAANYSFIKIVNLEPKQTRDFANKASAFHHGLVELGKYSYQYAYIGNLDADIVLEPSYFEQIVNEFERDPILGIAGGIVFTNIHGKYVTFDATIDSVGGAVQLFRKECFDAVGGYIPLQYGGIDAAAEIMAKALGWKVRKFPECKVYEQRRTGSAQAGLMKSKLREGRKFYSLGYGLLFYLTRCIYRINDPPFLIGSIVAFYGFLESLLCKKPILLPENAVASLQLEQNTRLKRMFTNWLSIKI